MERKKKKKKMSEVQLSFKPFKKQVKNYFKQPVEEDITRPRGLIILTVLRIKNFHLLRIKALLY
jgi:hypothetical protein